MCARLHNKTYFYKYTTAKVCKLILQNRTIRWSSPILFNDPFDCSCSFDYGFELSSAKELFVQETEKIVFGKKQVLGNLNHPLFAALQQSRRIRNNLPRREFHKNMCEIFDENAHNITAKIFSFRPEWEEFMKNHRILCLSESFNDILMWSHYANYHTGTVIRLRLIEELDNPVGAAVPIHYSEKVPSLMPSIDDFVKYSTGQKEIIRDNTYIQFVSTKSKNWEYEKEWRIICPPLPGQSNSFDDRPINPQEIDAIYFGCKISKEDQESITAMLTEDFGHVRVFKGEKDRFRYGLNFKPIK